MKSPTSGLGLTPQLVAGPQEDKRKWEAMKFDIVSGIDVA